MASICECNHSRADHTTGRCTLRRMRFEPSVGGTVSTQCGCKKFEPLGAAAPVVEAEPEVVEVPEEVEEIQEVMPEAASPPVPRRGRRYDR